VTDCVWGNAVEVQWLQQDRHYYRITESISR